MLMINILTFQVTIYSNNCDFQDLDIVISEGESHDEAQGQNTDAFRD